MNIIFKLSLLIEKVTLCIGILSCSILVIQPSDSLSSAQTHKFKTLGLLIAFSLINFPCTSKQKTSGRDLGLDNIHIYIRSIL